MGNLIGGNNRSNVNQQLQEEQTKKEQMNIAAKASQNRKKSSKSVIKKDVTSREPVQEETAPEASTSKEKGYAAGAKAVADGAGSGQSTVSTAGDALMAGGAATANPYSVAAGATLKVVGNVMDSKKKEEALDKANKLARKQDRRDNLEILVARLGTGVGSQGMS